MQHAATHTSKTTKNHNKVTKAVRIYAYAPTKTVQRNGEVIPELLGSNQA